MTNAHRSFVESMAQEEDREKATHRSVSYGEGRDGEECRSCYWYQEKTGRTCCAMVRDPIHPDGWCRLYAKGSQ